MRLKTCPHCKSAVAYYNGWDFNSRKVDPREGREPWIYCNTCHVEFGFGYYGRGVSDLQVRATMMRAFNRRD